MRGAVFTGRMPVPGVWRFLVAGVVRMGCHGGLFYPLAAYRTAAANGRAISGHFVPGGDADAKWLESRLIVSSACPHSS